MNGPALVNPTPSTDEVWEEHYTHRDYVYAQQAGPFEFWLNFPTALAPTDSLIIEMPIAFALAPEGQPDCYWNNYAADNCYFDEYTNPKRLHVYPPTGLTLAATTDHYLKVTTFNAELGVKGIVHATVPGVYTLTLRTSTDNGVSTREQQTTSLQVFARSFTWFTSTAAITNQNFKNSLLLEFRPETTIAAANARLVVYIPTRNEWGETLFDDDLRTGIANGGAITCHDVAGTLGGEPTCALTHGS
jgi:hypothetical protein